MTDEFLRGDVVSEEGVRWRVVVVRDKVTGLWHSEVIEVCTLAIVSAIDELSFRICCILHPVDLTRLRPEVLTSRELEPSKPELLGFGAILGIKLTCVDQDRALCSDELLNVV